MTYNYDIISLCETSSNESVSLPDKLIDNYKFLSCNSPNGKKQGAVGILFIKNHSPL